MKLTIPSPKFITSISNYSLPNSFSTHGNTKFSSKKEGKEVHQRPILRTQKPPPIFQNDLGNQQRHDPRKHYVAAGQICATAGDAVRGQGDY